MENKPRFFGAPADVRASPTRATEAEIVRVGRNSVQCKDDGPARSAGPHLADRARTPTRARPDYFCAVAAARACCCCWSICAIARDCSIANCFTSRFDEVASLFSSAVIFCMSLFWNKAWK